MPNMPAPFSPFLEDKKDCKENLKHLEHERKHTIENIKAMKGRLKQIDVRIAQIKKEAKPDSSADQKSPQ